MLQCCFDQVLGFRTGYENSRGYFEKQAEKLLRASDVLHGLAGQASLEEAFQLVRFIRGEETLGMSQQSCLVASQHMRKQHFGVAARIARGSGQAGARSSQSLAGAGRHFMPQWLFQP